VAASEVSGPVSAAPDPRELRVVVIVFFTVFLDLVGFGIIIPFLSLYVTSMGGTAETVGLLFASFSATQLLATPLLGRLSDRVGRRRVILLSLAGNAASMVLFAAASERHLLPLLFVSRILAGATAGNIAACQAAVADVTCGSNRSRGMGRVGAGIGLGMVLGPVIGSWAFKLGHSSPPLVAAALATLDLVAAFFLMPETRVIAAALPSEPEATSGGPGSRMRSALRARWVGLRALLTLLSEPRLAAVLVLYFLTFLYMTTLQVALPLLASARLEWTEKEIGNVFSLFGLVGVVVQGFLIGRMTRLVGAGNLVIAGAVSSGVGLAMIASAHSGAILITGLGLLALGLGLTNPVLSTLASEYAGAARQGVVLGFAQSAGGLARTLGPIATGVLYRRIGEGAPFTGGAVVALCALGLAVGVRATRRAEASRGPNRA
jgi:DHA1 family tetracycline resistance protein-like MFS transporter